VADEGGSAQASKPEHLNRNERGLAGALGIVMLIWGGVLLFCPPEHKELISGCKANATKDCVQTVSSVPETVTTAIVGVGGALLLIALLGIRFTSIKAGGIELGTSATETSKDEADDAAAKGKAKPVPKPAATTFQPATEDEAATVEPLQMWSLLPPHVREAAIRRWAASGKQGDPATQIDQVYAPALGNNDWYLVFTDDTTFRVTVAAT
jgi:hypothetical protein